MLNSDVKKKLVAVVGPEDYQDNLEVLYSFSYDSHFEEALPEAVIFPGSTQEVAAVLRIANEAVIPVTTRGAGTSICGAPIPKKQGIVLVMTRMNAILEVSPRDRCVRVQPGVVNQDLQNELGTYGFFYPPDPASLAVSTIGGNLAQNSGGPRGLKYGVTKDYIMGLEVVLASGRIIRFGSKNVKDVTGYNFAPLFCGAEGTLGVVTEAILRIVPLPEARRTVMATYTDLRDTANTVADVVGSGIVPVAMELMDSFVINAVEDAASLGLPREAEGLLLVEVDGVEEAVEKEMARIAEKALENGAVDIKEARSREEQDELWRGRRSAYGVMARLAPNCIVEDATVPVSRVPEMIEGMREIFARYELRVGILAHAGDGNMHPLIATDVRDREEWQRVEKAIREIFELALRLEGTLSGEHGIGLAKSEFLSMFLDQDTLETTRDIKKALDPKGILNPGKFC